MTITSEYELIAIKQFRIQELESELAALKATHNLTRLDSATLRFRNGELERLAWWVHETLAPGIVEAAAGIVAACTYESEEEARAGKYALPKVCFDALERLTKFANGIIDGTYLDINPPGGVEREQPKEAE